MDMNDLHKRLLTSTAKCFAGIMPRRFRLRALVATLKKTLIAERKEHLIILTACRKLVDDAVGIDFAGFETAIGKIGVVRSVGEILRFEAESGVRAVGGARVAAGGTIEVFAVVELDTWLVRGDFQHAAADGIRQAGG